MLTKRKEKFIEHYKSTRNASESARLAGYSYKCSKQVGSRLLRDIDVITALEEVNKNARDILTKDVFVSKALADYEAVSVEANNRPRFLEIAGKGAGILGNNESSSITNNTQININIVEVSDKPMNERLEFLRGIISPTTT